MLTMLAPWLPRMPATTASAPGSFLHHHRQPRGAAVRFVAPGEIDPVGVDPVGQALAADRVDLDPLALAAQADDAVARDRVAAFGELERHAGRQPLDRDRGALRQRLDRRPCRSSRAPAPPSPRRRRSASARSPPSAPRRSADAAAAAPRRSPPSRAGWAGAATISSKILRPSATVSSRSFDFTQRRIFARALPVTT